MTTAYAYTPASRLSSLAHNLEGAATANDANWAFGYNVAGQVVSRSLVQVYERTVSALNETYARNGLNQYTSVAGTSFTHDARGNLTSDGARSFSYDLESRLTAVSGAAAGNLIYDPLGRVRSYTAGGATTQFLYDGDRLIAEYNGAGGLLRRYVHGPGTDEPLAWYEGAGVADPRWLIADRQGSIIATTNASGAATTLGYGPYGEPSAWTGPGGALLSRFRYTGQAALPELQLYHYKARAYDPRLGRFLQTDPVGYEDDLNLYAYVGNDPGNASDPSGLCATGTGPNGEPRQVGICSSSQDMQQTIDGMIADPDSSLGATEAEAVAKGAIIQVQTRVDDPNVAAARTLQGKFNDQVAVVVQVDVAERGKVAGVNTTTGEPDTRELTDQETLEHEVGGHARGYVATGLPTGEAGPIDLENEYREKKGIPFRRRSHAGVVVPRNPPGVDK